MNGRTKRGQFASGNTFGVGRPKRAVELEYLAALSDVLSVDKWKAIVERAVDDATKGDDKARLWLAKYLIGDDARLSALARLDVLDVTPWDMVAAEVDAELHPSGDRAALQKILDGESLIERARRLKAESQSE